MNEMKPLVSIIMPVYNAQQYIEETLMSVLNQTYTEFEVIIVDDCSQDKSMDMVRRMADSRFVILENNRNCGIAFSRNRAIRKSKGKYIAILDNDDIALPDRLERQVHYLEQYFSIGVIGGESVWIDEKGRIIQERKFISKDPDYIKTSFLFENMYNNSEVMFRKSVIEDNNIKYCDDMLGMEDFKFWIDCTKVCKFSNLDRVVLKRRMVKTNTTSKIQKEKAQERAQVFAQLQEYSLRKSGFCLETDEYELIHQLIKEDISKGLADLKKVKKMYLLMKKIIDQAQENQFAMISEVRKYLQERFVRCL
jgi:Predicted glycosyltransferases